MFCFCALILLLLLQLTHGFEGILPLFLSQSCCIPSCVCVQWDGGWMVGSIMRTNSWYITHTHTLLQWDWSTAVVCSADIHTFIQSSHTPILQLPCHYHHIINVYHSNTLILQIYLAIFIQQICRIGQRLRNVLFSVLEICRNHFLMWMLLVRCGGADRS